MTATIPQAPWHTTWPSLARAAADRTRLTEPGTHALIIRMRTEDRVDPPGAGQLRTADIRKVFATIDARAVRLIRGTAPRRGRHTFEAKL